MVCGLMNEHKLGRILAGIDMNTYWYSLSAGKQNKGVKLSCKTNQVKLHKKYKEEKIKKEKKDKEKENKEKEKQKVN